MRTYLGAASLRPYGRAGPRAGLAVVVVAQAKPELPGRIGQRNLVERLMGEVEIAEVSERGRVGEAVHKLRGGEFPFVAEAEVQAQILQVGLGGVAIALVAELETEASREEMLGLLQEIIAHACGGGIVDIDVLDPVKTTFIADIPGHPAREVIRVINPGLELIGALGAVGNLPVVGGVKLQGVIRRLEGGAKTGRGPLQIG